MAQTFPALVDISRAGVSGALAAANADGSLVQNNGRVFILAKNGDVSSKTVTITPQAQVAGQSISAVAVIIAAGVTEFIGPFPPEVFNNANGQIAVTYSAVTSVTVGFYRLP